MAIMVCTLAHWLKSRKVFMNRWAATEFKPEGLLELLSSSGNVVISISLVGPAMETLVDSLLVDIR